MKWIILTCDNSKKIVDAQYHLLQKYVLSTFEDIDILYVDLEDLPVSKWSSSVLSCIPDDEYVVFGLDDFLPIELLNVEQYNKAIDITKREHLDRFELGWGASKKSNWIKGLPNGQFINNDDHLRYGSATPYTTSCQFSIWRTSKLKEILSSRPMNAWEFETKTSLQSVGCFESSKCAFRYIEESAISSRQQGKVNVLGLRHEDVKELIDLKYLDRKDIIYSWQDLPFSKELAGTKYAKYYD